MSALPGRAVAVVSNAASGHNRDQFGRIAAMLEACPGLHHRVTSSPAEIPETLAALAALDPAVLAINGGDGTASAILGEMLQGGYFSRTPIIALLPGGTANMNAGDIGVRGSLARAVQRFCDWCNGDRALGDRIARRALMRVQRGAGDAVHHGMFLGAGAVIQGTEYAHREIHARGLRDDFSLALGTLRTVWGVVRDDPAFNRHVSISLSRDGGESAAHDTLILAISTLQRLAFGMRPFWSEEPGRIRITLMEQHCSRFLTTFISIIRGRPNRNAVPQSGYFSHNADHIALSLEGNVNLDGEILPVSGPLTISATPELEFLKL